MSISPKFQGQPHHVGVTSFDAPDQPAVLNTVGARFVHGRSGGYVSADKRLGKRFEFHERARAAKRRFFLRVPCGTKEADARKHFVYPPRKSRQHFKSVLLVFGFAENPSVQRHHRIRAEHRRAERRRQRRHFLRLMKRQGLHHFTGGKGKIRFFLAERGAYLEGGAEFFQQFLSPRGTARQDQFHLLLPFRVLRVFFPFGLTKANAAFPAGSGAFRLIREFPDSFGTPF